MADWIESQRGIIGKDDCDVNRHMNVTGYFSRFGEASGYLLSLGGVYYGDLVALGFGLGTVVNTLRYSSELVDGDRYLIESAVIRLGNTSIRYVHKMIIGASGKLSASADFVEALFDFKTRRSTPWTDAMRARLEPLVVTLSDADQAWFDGARRAKIHIK